MGELGELTPKQARFVAEYPKDMNARKAAERSGYSPKTAHVQGSRLLSNAKISTAIERRLANRAERVQIEADDVLSELWTIAKADPRELVEYRRNCCRYCYGTAHKYQRTQAEMDSYEECANSPYRDKHMLEEAQYHRGKAGGVGFDPRKPPNAGCPECLGEGEGEAFVKDTRFLSPAARRLYAGVKVTKDGLEIKMHDQAAALVNVGKHLGMFGDKLQILDDPRLKTFLTIYARVLQSEVATEVYTRIIGRINGELRAAGIT